MSWTDTKMTNISPKLRAVAKRPLDEDEGEGGSARESNTKKAGRGENYEELSKKHAAKEAATEYVNDTESDSEGDEADLTSIRTVATAGTARRAEIAENEVAELRAKLFAAEAISAAAEAVDDDHSITRACLGAQIERKDKENAKMQAEFTTLRAMFATAQDATRRLETQLAENVAAALLTQPVLAEISELRAKLAAAEDARDDHGRFLSEEAAARVEAEEATRRAEKLLATEEANIHGLQAKIEELEADKVSMQATLTSAARRAEIAENTLDKERFEVAAAEDWADNMQEEVAELHAKLATAAAATLRAERAEELLKNAALTFASVVAAAALTRSMD
ncbi:hypothetical protein T484DRAFT_1973940 [Baffinella frigidus]|nr:hypothetical protein T484DRAFT_1973940 [Cryptophyta sp. CCMP2293]